jgi:hypothetical protein
MLHGGSTSLLQMAQLRLLDLALCHHLVANLHSVVAVCVGSLDLCDHIATLQSDNSSRDAQALRGEVGHHACLGAENANTGLRSPSLHNQPG